MMFKSQMSDVPASAFWALAVYGMLGTSLRSAALAGLGLLTALVGISLALLQRDVKRVLAYSSIENVGLIGLALGVGLWGRASHLPEVAGVGEATPGGRGS